MRSREQELLSNEWLLPTQAWEGGRPNLENIRMQDIKYSKVGWFKSEQIEGLVEKRQPFAQDGALQKIVKHTLNKRGADGIVYSRAFLGDALDRKKPILKQHVSKREALHVR